MIRKIKTAIWEFLVAWGEFRAQQIKSDRFQGYY